MSTAPIPFLDLPRQHEPLLPQLMETLQQIVKTAGFIGGKHVDEFEAAFATFCGAKHTVGVANGTDALVVALKCLGVGPGDTVIVPTYTFIATAEAVTLLGATPRFVDIDPTTYTMSPEALATTDAGNVKAIIPVHLYGQAADMAPIMKLARARGWKVLEDAAQCHGGLYQGKPVGGLADLGSFSFYPGKNLGAMGDAGAVTGNDAELMAHVRRFANHGRTSKYEHGEPGVNSRLDALQAAALALKLKHLADWNAKRATVAGWYDERLRGIAGVGTPVVGAQRTHTYHLYVAEVPERDRLLPALDAAKIGHGVHYHLPLHLQPAYRSLGYQRGDFPAAERASSRVISLPMFPELTLDQVERVTQVIRTHARAGG